MYSTANTNEDISELLPTCTQFGTDGTTHR